MTNWKCECGNIGIYRDIQFHDEEKTVYICYCDDCRKEYRLTEYKEKE